MGGLGSGGHNKYKATLENCRSIDIRRFKREGYMETGAKIQWNWFTDQKVTASIGIVFKKDRLILSYKVNNQEEIADEISLDVTECNYGGARHWFECPGCGKRAAKLYLRGKYFRCRSCQDLNYRSSQKSGDIFEQIDNQIYITFRKIQKSGSPFGEMMFRVPGRPPNMHMSTYIKLASELRTLWNRRSALFSAIAKEKFGFTG